MRDHQLKISLSFFCIVLVGVIFHSQVPYSKDAVVVGEVAGRQPASSTPQLGQALAEKVLQSDVYQFDRRIKAVLNKKEVLTDIQYSGHMFVDWKKIQGQERTGIFSFQVKDSSVPAVFAEVGFSNGFSISSLKVTNASNENEENAVLFLKDLISIYAFKTFEDTSGKYSAKVRMVNDSGKKQIWLKNKLKYDDGMLAQYQFNQSVHEVHLADTLLEEASGLEETQMGNEIKTRGVYLLKHLDSADAAKFQHARNDSSTPLIAVSIKTNPNHVTASKVSWSEMEKKLSELRGATGKARLALFHEMLKDLKGNPDALRSFADWMQGNLQDPNKASLAIGVLSGVGTSEAQHELVQVYDQVKNSSPDTAHLILNSLATNGSKLSPEAKTMLSSVLENRQENPDLAANAAYALGAAGEVKKITELAEQATSKNEKIVYIDAMGNSGSLDTLPFLLASTQSPDPQIREKAVFALRFVDDIRVKNIFEQSMNDSDLNVRSSVVKAVPFQPNTRQYESLLKSCSVQATDTNLKTLCSQTLVNL